MVTPDEAIAAGRRIAGLIGHSPGPGIYSRMQRAVEAMPEMVRAEELPGLIRRHKEGVPGWELKAVDLPSLYEGRTAVPREELLRAVQERSPLYTHGEVVKRGSPDDYDEALQGPFDSRIGQGMPAEWTEYAPYSQGGDDYTEILLTQPGARYRAYGNHWGMADAVAHARFDRHGDALRINELQSDLGIHNRRQREAINNAPDDATRLSQKLIDFPLEDAWLDLLIKRLALETARGGYRAIEIATPRSIADKVGGNIDNYEHLYGKVVPGALERLGRKMGGLTEEGTSNQNAIAATGKEEPWADVYTEINRLTGGLPVNFEDDYAPHVNYLADILTGATEDGDPAFEASRFYEMLVRDAVANGADSDAAAREIGLAMPRLARSIENAAVRDNDEFRASQMRRWEKRQTSPPGRRYLMSDEMRRNILRNGIPASVLGAAALSNERQP